MTQEELSNLLGRPLTTIEANNFDLYLDIAMENLEELTCTTFEFIEEERTFDVREGFSTAFVDIFTSASEVKLDDVVADVSDYHARQWDKRNSSWFNSLVFDDKLECQELKVTAEWGFDLQSGEGSDLPADLQLVLAGLFALITKKNKYDGSVSSKQVEDFRINFNADADLDDEFYQKYNKTLAKYGLCHISDLKHGKVKCGEC